MTKDEKIKRIAELKMQAKKLKKEVDYYNALQLALKLVLNGSYGAFATQYFILFNNKVAGTITAEGRALTRTMSQVNEDYWYNQWHLDYKTHKKMYIKDVQKIQSDEPVSIYGDTDSIFVGFEPAINSCTWKNNILNVDTLKNIPTDFGIIATTNYETNNPKYMGTYIKTIDNTWDKLDELIPNVSILVISSDFIKDWQLDAKLKDFKGKVIYNWETELDFIHGLDKFRIEQFFKDELSTHAATYGVDNVQDFELEKISDSMINLEKKKYIQHISWEDGIYYDKLSYLQPKGVELVRSSTPPFARDPERGIPKLLTYLFNEPDNFNIKELLSIVKEMRKGFEMAPIDDIAMQTSCSKYKEKVINDNDKLEFVLGAHFAVKAAGYHNFLLNKDVTLQTKYQYLKSGDKIKYYYTKNEYQRFAYKRGEYPIEFAPEVDYDTQFEKSVLKPINSIITKLNMPTITKRLSVIMDIFGSL